MKLLEFLYGLRAIFVIALLLLVAPFAYLYETVWSKFRKKRGQNKIAITAAISRNNSAA